MHISLVSEKNHSTSLALIEVIDNIYENLDEGANVCGIYLDLHKAFDMVTYCLTNYFITVLGEMFMNGLKATLIIGNNLLMCQMFLPVFVVIVLVSHMDKSWVLYFF